MYYTEEQIEEVRSKSDIVQIIGRYVNLKRTGSSYVGLCPFHSEKSPSFNVSPSRQMYMWCRRKCNNIYHGVRELYFPGSYGIFGRAGRRYYFKK